ncbi:MAG: YlxR family protein [Acidimicrobiia bacterium]
MTAAGPQRTCVGCRRRGSPNGWLRVAAGPDGAVRIGRTARGRGAWCCSTACFEEAVRRGALSRALRRPLTTTELSELRATLCN